MPGEIVLTGSREEFLRQVLLITDGHANAGPDPVRVAQELGRRGVQVNTVGILDGGHLGRKGRQQVQAIARAGQGDCRLLSSSELTRAVRRLLSGPARCEQRQRVVLLVDVSGSMTASRDKLRSLRYQVQKLFGQWQAAAGSQLSCLLFPGLQGRDIELVVDWDQQAKLDEAQFRNCGGLTPTGAALWWAGYKLGAAPSPPVDAPEQPGQRLAPPRGRQQELAVGHQPSMLDSPGREEPQGFLPEDSATAFFSSPGGQPLSLGWRSWLGQLAGSPGALTRWLTIYFLLALAVLVVVIWQIAAR